MPLIIPFSEGILDSDCESQVFFTFNCTSPCLKPQLVARVGCANRPLILVSNVFLIKRSGELVQPVRELTRNILIAVEDIPRDISASSSVGTGAVANDSTEYKPSSPVYRPTSPDYHPSTPLYAPEDEGYPAPPSPDYRPNSLPSTSGLGAQTAGSRRGRRASKRKAGRQVRFN